MNSIFDHELIEQLHASARSLVYRARSLHGQTPLIIKVCNRDYPSFEQVTRFKREYDTARRCLHPGVIRPLALRQERGRWTMALEDTGGTALSILLHGQAGADAGASADPGAARGALALEDFFDIALQLCAALEVVHGQGVIHKDINPSNLIWNGARRHLQLIDFGIASVLAQESQGIVHPATLEGTLRYMAPEQTGRMNRLVDYRADYYALGATFYELLTGQPPFTAGDAMELVHCHIARTPDWSLPALAALPVPLLAIVQRLLEKNADQRYQTLYGLKRDLECCRAAAQATAAGAAAAVPAVGFADRQHRFLVPQQLHGRERERAALLGAFERSAAGASEMLLLAGAPGIGKSALVHEVQRAIVARRGRFVAGKCDQFRRDVPYAALIHAFQGLLLQLLGEPEDQLQQWRQRLQAALGSDLDALTELLPALALVAGVAGGAAVADEAEPSPALPPEQAQVRLGRAFQHFVAALAATGQPLVWFLDDLQWADTPTLRLIELLLGERTQQHLLFIGAYRDNEAAALLPLTALRERLRRGGASVGDLVLAPLDEAQVGRLLAATLRVPATVCAPLTRLCFRKTGGNPFFLNQFLLAIHDAGHLHYRPERDCWGWNLAALEQADYTDNVVDLLLEKIRRLPADTQQLLQLAAAIGNRFRLDTLALLFERSPAQTQHALWPALDAGLIQPQDQLYKYLATGAAETDVSYRFLHDRVQQAAYALAGADARPALHLRIGRLRLRHASAQQREEQLFAIVEQLNAGSALIDTDDEKLQLAELNRQAGVKARRSAAFQATLRHLNAGLALLPPDGWQRHHALWLELQLGAAEAAYLCGNFDAADAVYPLLLARCGDTLEQVRCIAVQAHQYQLQGRLHDAIAVLRHALALLGIAVPHDTAALKSRFAELLAEIACLPGADDTEALLAADALRDRPALAAMQLMQGLWMASYYAGQQDLSALMVLSMTQLSMRQGVSDFSAVAYVGYAYIQTLAGGDMARGYRYGAMALALARRRANLQTRTLTGLMFAALTSHWTRPLRDSEALYDEAFGWALEIADFVQVGVVVAVRATERLILGDYLPDLRQGLESDLALMRANGQQAMADCCVAAALQPIRCLMGQTPRNDSYDDEHFSEARFLAQYGGSRLYHAYFLQGKIRNAFLFDSAEAETLAAQLNVVSEMMRGQAKVPEATFYAALIWLRALRRAPQRDDAAALLARASALLDELTRWAALGPDNLRPKQLLVQAELARLRRDLPQATRCYQEGIEAASAAGYIQIQALGNELCGDCWLELGQPRVAAVYLQEALARYRQWGAEGKAAQLDAQHQALLAGGAGRAALSGMTTATHGGATLAHGLGNAALDLDSILKAAQALSNEIGLNQVLRRLLLIVRENSGAQVARLLLLDHGNWRLEADCSGDADDDGRGDDGAAVTLHARALAPEATRDTHLPLSLLRYVMRSGEEVIEDNVALSPRFGADPYVRLRRTRSVLCLPIRRAGQVEGILYLENNLADGSFTPARIEFLRLLGAQALTAISHARLHDSLEQRVAERTAQLEEANRKLATLSVTDGLTGLSNRRHFDEVLRTEWARAHRQRLPLAVIMVDVDHFKKYNDRYGHQAGDACLIAVAQALQGCSRRGGDLAARYGGEEFALVLPDTGAAAALEVAEALREAVERLNIAHGGSVLRQVTISVGVAVELHERDGAPDALMRAADAALYRAKHGGRNRVAQAGQPGETDQPTLPPIRTEQEQQ